MIYLIGGPPKCGKTTLAKKLTKNLGIPWVATDTLQVVAMAYIKKFAAKQFNTLYPHNAMRGETNDETYSLISPKQIARNYITQAKASYAAIEMFSISEIQDGNDYIIEGYHITPQLVSQLIKKYGRKHFRVLFLVKSDTNKFIRDVQKSSTPNDWIIARTKKAETLTKIADMVNYYGQHVSKEAKKYGFTVLNMDDNFNKLLHTALRVFSQRVR